MVTRRRRRCCWRPPRGADGAQAETLRSHKAADAALVEAGFLDLQIGAVQRIRRQFFHGKAHGFRRGAEATIGKTGPLLLRMAAGNSSAAVLKLNGRKVASSSSLLFIFLVLGWAEDSTWPVRMRWRRSRQEAANILPIIREANGESDHVAGYSPNALGISMARRLLACHVQSSKSGKSKMSPFGC